MTFSPLLSIQHLRAAKYGDTADECGEAAFLCGKSLLELARFVKFLLFFLDYVLLSGETQTSTLIHFGLVKWINIGI